MENAIPSNEEHFDNDATLFCVIDAIANVGDQRRKKEHKLRRLLNCVSYLVESNKIIIITMIYHKSSILIHLIKFMIKFTGIVARKYSQNTK